MADYSPYVHGAHWPAGSEIEMFGQRLRIVKNHGAWGVVEKLDGTRVESLFFWSCLGEKAKLVVRSV